jgi:CheY-like chemotaxis protein
MNPRAVIADDEPLMREQLRARITEAWPELEIVGEARNGIEAVEKTSALSPDLVFLDIRMPGMTGIEAARRIAALEPAEGTAPPEIVFVTAYDEYAIQAFEQGVVDYLLKPVDRDGRGRGRADPQAPQRGDAPGAAPAIAPEGTRFSERLQARLEGEQAAGYLK